MDKIYADPSTSTKNPALLAKRTNEALETSYTTAQAKVFLTSFSVNKKIVKPKRSAMAPTGASAGHWQSDVIWFDLLKGKNNMHRAILTVLNTTSRYAYARGLRSNKSAVVCEALKDIFTEMINDNKKIVALRIDGGSEMAELLKSRGILIDQTEPYTHSRLARTDRFHRTLREKFGELFEINDSDRWIDALPAIVKNLNNTPHETLSQILGREATPKSITMKDEKLIRAHELKQVAIIQAKTNKLNEKIHLNRTRCRVLVSKTKAGILERFSKSQRNVWSRKTYLITGRNGVNSWIVDVDPGEVSIWATHSLQILTNEESDKITDELLDLEAIQLMKKDVKKESQRVNIKVAKAQRMEDRNISPAERAVSLAAPARPKRAARVDYKALIKS